MIKNYLLLFVEFPHQAGRRRKFNIFWGVAGGYVQTTEKYKNAIVGRDLVVNRRSPKSLPTLSL